MFFLVLFVGMFAIAPLFLFPFEFFDHLRSRKREVPKYLLSFLILVIPILLFIFIPSLKARIPDFIDPSLAEGLMIFAWYGLIFGALILELSGGFGPPNIAKLKAWKDMEKLEYALSYKKNKGDKGNTVRIAAAQALGEIGGSLASRILVGQIYDPHFNRIELPEELRQTIVQALGNIGDLDAVRALVAESGSTASSGRMAEENLVRMGPKAFEPLLALIKQRNFQACRIFRKIDGFKLKQEDHDELIRDLDSNDINRPGFAAIALGILREPRAFDALISHLQSKAWGSPSNPRVAEALGEYVDPRAVEPLIRCLDDLNIGEEAALALGKIGDERAIKPLIEARNKPMIEGTSWRAVHSDTADKAIEMIRQRAK
jgi:HEAT repeat protein